MNPELHRVALNEISLVVITDPTGRITHANANFCRLAQYSLAELIGQPYQLFQVNYPEKDFFEQIITTVAANRVWRGEIKNKAKNGAYFWLDTLVYPQQDAPDQITGYFWCGLDSTAHKEATAEITRQVQRTERLIESKLDAFLTVDGKWRITRVNKILEAAVGLSRHQLVGRNFLRTFISKTNASQQIAALRQAGQAQSPTHFEFYYAPRATWFEANVYPIGEGLALTFRNITEQKAATEKIRRSDQQLRAIMQSTVDVFFFIGLDMRVIIFNDRARQSIRYLYNHELRAGDDIRQCCLEGDSRVFMECFQQALGGEPVQLEREVRREDKTAWYWMTYFPVVDHEQRVIGVVINAANINSLKFLEAETLRINERFRLAAKATNDALYDRNLEQNQIQWYEALYELFGYTTCDVESSSSWWSSRIHPGEAEVTVNSLNEAIQAKRTHWSAEYRFQCRDGRYKYVCDRGYLVYSESGVPLRMIGALQDIQQVKEHELKIIQQNEQLREIAFSQSHEVRRPVANILGLLRCLSKEEFGPENQKVLHFLEQTAAELDILIRKIVDKTYHT